MKILITGAGGGLGGELPAVFTEDELVSLTHADLDIADAAAVADRISDEAPKVVIHCAAYNAVDAAEEDEQTARAVNVDGTRNVAEAATAAGAVLVAIGSDYVFDGTKTAPYLEADDTNPQSAYARSKRDGERAALEAAPAGYVLRTSWLYSQGGKSFASTMLNLFETKDELTVVADEVSSPTYSRDFARAIQQLLRTKPEPGLYHASCEGETSWRDYAVEIARQVGKDITINPTTAAEWGAAAARPHYSKLDGSKLTATGITLPTWQESLTNYLSDRGLTPRT